MNLPTALSTRILFFFPQRIHTVQFGSPSFVHNFLDCWLQDCARRKREEMCRLCEDAASLFPVCASTSGFTRRAVGKCEGVWSVMNHLNARFELTHCGGITEFEQTNRLSGLCFLSGCFYISHLYTYFTRYTDANPPACVFIRFFYISNHTYHNIHSYLGFLHGSSSEA